MGKIQRLFRGRINRAQWFIGLSLIVAAFVVVGVVQNVLLSILEDAPSVALTLVAPLGLVALLCLFIVEVSLSVRRFHDIGHSGWKILLAIIPLVNVAVFFYLAIKPGMTASNEYGEPPTKRGVFSTVFNASTNV